MVREEDVNAFSEQENENTKNKTPYVLQNSKNSLESINEAKVTIFCVCAEHSSKVRS